VCLLKFRNLTKATSRQPRASFCWMEPLREPFLTEILH
jgi:hypothetical protein